MGSLQSKLDWLIDRKIELVNFIKYSTTYYNRSSSLNYSGTYADITMTSVVTELNTYFPNGFVEVVYCRMFDSNGTSASSYFADYTSRGVSVSVTRNGTGQFTVSMTRASDLTNNVLEGSKYYFYLYSMGSHRGTNFNTGIYTTASPTSSPEATTLTWKLITGDEHNYYDGYFTIIIFALKKS